MLRFIIPSECGSIELHAMRTSERVNRTDQIFAAVKFELLNKEIAMSIPQLEPIETVLKSRGVSRSTLYAEIKDGRWPKPLQISLRKRAWLTDEIEKMMRFYMNFPSTEEQRDFVRSLEAKRLDEEAPDVW